MGLEGLEGVVGVVGVLVVVVGVVPGVQVLEIWIVWPIEAGASMSPSNSDQVLALHRSPSLLPWPYEAVAFCRVSIFPQRVQLPNI